MNRRGTDEDPGSYQGYGRGTGPGALVVPVAREPTGPIPVRSVTSLVVVSTDVGLGGASSVGDTRLVRYVLLRPFLLLSLGRPLVPPPIISSRSRDSGTVGP